MLHKIYAKSPVFLQNVYISIYGYYWKNRRYGGCFKEKIQEFQARDSFSKEQWKAYQTVALQKLLVHAFTTVPFYTEMYKKHGFGLQDFEKFQLEDIQKLPFLEKEDVRKYGATLLLSTKKKKGTFYNSSGSTGTPTQLYFSKEMHQTWSALYETRVRNWAGVDYKMPRAMLGGRRILASSKLKPPFYRFNTAESQAYFSAYHISDISAKEYVIGLEKTRATYLVGYAMSIYILAQSIEKQQLKAPKLNAVLTSSEKLTLQMRNTIERVFQCKVFDAYSGLEACGLISENKFGELLFSPDSGIMEVLNTEGNPVNKGECGEVIATGFLNYDQPLIRYRIGDRIQISKDQKTRSGSEMLKIDKIEGRMEDIIIGMDGRKMVRFHGIFVGISSIMMAQVIQQSFTKIDIKLVVDVTYTNENEAIMTNRIKSQLGNVAISYIYVDAIDNTKNGKYKAVISNL